MKKPKHQFPSPLSIALSLTALVFLSAWWLKTSQGTPPVEGLATLVLGWYDGLWDNSAGGLYFAFQMILILVLGHVLALTVLFKKFISSLTVFCTNSANAALTISLTAIVLGYINWGLALVLSALLVKQVLIKFQQENKKVNVGLLGAAAYTCMLVWHGGLSGSSPTKASEPNAIRDMLNHAGYTVNHDFPEVFGAQETLFSALNIAVFVALIVVLPLLLYGMGKKIKSREERISLIQESTAPSFHFQWNSSVFVGVLILVVAGFVTYHALLNNTNFLNINFINLCLLGFGILFHNSLSRFTEAVHHAIQDASGILIQFPIYFGIIGLMKTSGLTHLMSDAFVAFASQETFPLFSFLSAGILNFFIPSGGGQFYIQGPMLIKSAMELGVSIPKTILALSYGDQWTNMLQPFWALPLLGITKIKLSQLLPYCFMLFVVSGVIFMAALYLF